MFKYIYNGIWINDIFSQLLFFFINLPMSNILWVRHRMIFLIFFYFNFLRDAPGKTEFVGLSKRRQKICIWFVLLNRNKRLHMLSFLFAGDYFDPPPPASVTVKQKLRISSSSTAVVINLNFQRNGINLWLDEFNYSNLNFLESS